MKLLPLSVLATILGAGAAQAQSMNVRAITDDVLREICVPFSSNRDMREVLSTAERLGYSVVAHEPGDLRRGAADAQPSPSGLALFRRHHGTVRVSIDHDRVLCGVAMEEGTVRAVAAAAAPHLRALGMTPAVDDVEGTPALSVWRGPGRQVVIAASPRHRPGVELTLEVAPQGRAN